MPNTASQTRANRTITIDLQNEATYFLLLGDGKAFVEFVIAFILSLGFQLKHKAMCHGGGCLTRNSHYLRVRLGGVTIWRFQCTTCRAVFTILPHCILRYRQMRPCGSGTADVHGCPRGVAPLRPPTASRDTPVAAYGRSNDPIASDAS